MKLLVFILTMLPFLAFSQEPLQYSEVIEVNGANKDELFIRAREWFNGNFKSAKDVLQIIDKDNGELAGKGVMEVPFEFTYITRMKYLTHVSFQMSIWVKDGRYKYELTNLDIIANSDNIPLGLITTSNETNVKCCGYSKRKMSEMYLSIKQNTELKAKSMIEDLQVKMSAKSKSSDW